MFKAKPREQQSTLRAKYTDDDGRYAEIKGIAYPVLLASFQTGDDYAEDMQETDDYPDEWKKDFLALFNRREAAIIAFDSGKIWPFRGLFQVHDIRLTNFLTCRIGACLTKLRFQ
jgi:hypothetical protein